MLFGATLKTNSPIHRNWRSQSLLKGTLEGVQFRYTSVEYVVDKIPGDKVKALLAHNNVVVHAIAPLVTSPVVEDAPVVSEEVVHTSDTPAPKPRGRPPLSRK